MSRPWSGSNRKSRLPANWELLRRQVGSRDGWACQWVIEIDGRRQKCLRKANEVDHIVAGDDHRLENLRCLCTYHHAKKSGREGKDAQAQRRRAAAQKFVRTEQHPGLI